MRLAAVVAAALLLATPAAAQIVGAEPAESPYRDIRYGHSVNGLVMGFWGDGGEVDVGPGNGTFYGFRYDLKVTDPISLGFGVLTGTPERELIDPELSPDERFLGTIEERVTMVELGLNFTATGAKTWNGLAPYAGAAVGLAFSSGDEDIGGYKFGVKVYLAPMIGTRYFLGEHLFLRAEGRATLWKLSYPSTYFAPWPPSDISGDPELAVLPGGPESEWVTSLGLVLGLGYNFRW